MYRYEKKYLINKFQIEMLKNNLSATLNFDTNVKNSDGVYFIRSLYFDDYNNTNYFQVLDGVSKREKYRIRYYDYDESYITLEKKSKINNLGKKDKDIINKQTVDSLISLEKIVNCEPLVDELQTKISTRLYKPVIIIDYLRMAFIYPLNDVRITIDYNISCSYEIDKFFEKNINSIPLLEKDMAILEVKYNDYLPDVVKFILNQTTLEVTSFSKYSTGREMLEKIERSV